MKKAGIFFKSIVPVLIIIVLQFIASFVMMIIYAAKTMEETGFDIDSLLGNIMSVANDSSFTQNVGLVYGVIGIILFGIWYRSVFIKPFKNRPKNYPAGFSFHTVVAIVCLAVGLQYICRLVTDLTASVNIEWLTNYNNLMETAGYDSLSILLIIYTIILAPIVEELTFRGLVFRYARHALPFWIANIWQALLFGIIHLNVIQGVYAFTVGLFLGWVCHRGRGIKYSILLHMIFNLFGAVYAGLFSLTMSFSYNIFLGLGIAITIFGIWLFYTDFESEPERR